MNEKTMTVKEVAVLFKCGESSIKRAIETLRPLLGELFLNNQGGYLLNQMQVTAIKLELEKHHNLVSADELPVTKLNKALLIKQAMELQNEFIAELEIENKRLSEENQLMLPKVESFEALQRSGENMSISECAKHFGLHPKTQVFPFLRTRGYLTVKDLPTQKAIDRKMMIERQTKGNDGVYRGQAVVENSSLELWRTRIVPAIVQWHKGNCYDSTKEQKNSR